MDPDGAVRLLSAILAGVQPLPGAKCIGKHELFDELHSGYGRRHRDRERERLARAAACCAGCPARTQCTTVTTSSTVSGGDLGAGVLRYVHRGQLGAAESVVDSAGPSVGRRSPVRLGVDRDG